MPREQELRQMIEDDFWVNREWAQKIKKTNTLWCKELYLTTCFFWGLTSVDMANSENNFVQNVNQYSKTA